MELKENLPEKIRQLRLAKGFSQENMADMLGVSTTAYGDLERGRTELTLSRIESVANILEVSMPHLLGIADGTLPEIDYLRQENARLVSLNGRLLNELEQWKKWYWQYRTQDEGTGRERIGF
ncbi:helix-turn-helix protein [Dyadobacter jejuensis]|uniref:Helix-turn-helix protein n=1 Tax=Dyadobacter jejuensis TaxID=1082580 RepID=A0A316ASE8_9BACT|nr:helix-turn-helix transcriptional regulator [Dyadobacter jejuensis]PWJ60351.1 helix-turn-helix protein [Dyadobacter jejuensis]